jgi:outer membrane protein OmpA-like peptidoglycan-associated protein
MTRIVFFTIFFSVIGFSQNKKEEIPIFFESNSFEITSSERAKLTAFFTQPNIKISTLTIEGFCDDIGNAETNAILSQKRATAVGDYIQNQYQISPQKILGKGEIASGVDSFDPDLKARVESRKVILCIEYTIQEKINKIQPVIAKKNPPIVRLGYKTFDDVLAVGHQIIIENLIFEGSSTDFLDVEKADFELKKIVEYFQKNPNLKFEIHGHVCCISSSFRDARDNNTGLSNLSESRAERIYHYFIENGIASERMSFKGFGRKFPRKGVTEHENKRVEIVISAI